MMASSTFIYQVVFHVKFEDRLSISVSRNEAICYSSIVLEIQKMLKSSRFLTLRQLAL